MLSELVNGVVQVADAQSLFVTIVGGLIGGVMASFFAPSHTLRAVGWYVIHITFMFNSVLALFWVGRVTVAVVSRDPLWGRVVGGWLLMLLFTSCAGIGIYLGLRLRTRIREGKSDAAAVR